MKLSTTGAAPIHKGNFLKLNIEKAFDKLNWSFLYSIMSHKSFNKNWLDWIRGCISSVNGKPRGRINATKGIRQGARPLSHFLFVLAMDYLSQLLDDAFRKGLIKGYYVQQRNLHRSHLLFANDILLFSITKETKIQNLFYLIKGFERASGLRINVQKSTIYGVNVPQMDLVCDSSPPYHIFIYIYRYIYTYRHIIYTYIYTYQIDREINMYILHMHVCMCKERV